MNWFATGAVLGGVGVMLGAFGAHGLRHRLPPDLLTIFELAVRYQLYHALALLAVGYLADRYASGWTNAAGWLFIAGVLIFSGSLYLLSLTGVRWLGAITPLGGLCLIAGWATLAVAALHK